HRDRPLVAAELERLGRLGDAFRELWREEALEVAAREELALNALRELPIFDRDGGDSGERDAELEIFVAEAMGGGDVVDVEHAECSVFAADERHADRRTDLLHEDRLAAEARVFTGIVGQD